MHASDSMPRISRKQNPSYSLINESPCDVAMPVSPVLQRYLHPILAHTHRKRSGSRKSRHDTEFECVSVAKQDKERMGRISG